MIQTLFLSNAYLMNNFLISKEKIKQTNTRITYEMT